MQHEQRIIGIIGAGNMGEAILAGALHAGIVQPNQAWISDVRSERLAELAARYGVGTTPDSGAVFRQSDTVVLAVKPQHMPALLASLAAAPGYAQQRQRTLAISVAAGISLASIEAVLYAPLSEPLRQRLPLVRAMPNTPALVRCGMTAISVNAMANEADLARALELFESLGQALVLPEPQLDAVTAVSGSGPAYVYFLMENLIRGGVEAGLAPAVAETLALQTVKGAAALMEASREPAESLRRKVTSPGGTTEAALRVFADRGVGASIVEAVHAAARRAAELGAASAASAADRRPGPRD
jgi:pyrroline-5-carboxylate reductase